MTASFTHAHLNLEYTLECGQTFRWKRLEDGFYYGVNGEAFIRIRQDGTNFTYETAPQPDDWQIVADCFGLTEQADHDYQNILTTISTDEHISKAIKRYRGLRLIRQPAFELLISFILAANNNIAAVSRSVQAISKKYGQAIRLGRYQGYTFPTPEVLAEVSLDTLANELGADYRAKYVRDTTQAVLKQGGNLDYLADLPYDFGLGQLMIFPGVGRSVADYVLLFGFGKLEAFPVDFWVQRAMETFYFAGQAVGEKKVAAKEILKLANAKWGDKAGYANEFLYMYARNHLK